MANWRLDNELDLPFDWTGFASSTGWLGRVHTTEPSPLVQDDPNDRCQGDAVSELLASTDQGACELARFVSTALNEYVATAEGLAHWKAVHPFLQQVRQAQQDLANERGEW